MASRKLVSPRFTAGRAGDCCDCARELKALTSASITKAADSVLRVSSRGDPDALRVCEGLHANDGAFMAAGGISINVKAAPKSNTRCATGSVTRTAFEEPNLMTFKFLGCIRFNSF